MHSLREFLVSDHRFDLVSAQRGRECVGAEISRRLTLSYAARVV